MSIYDQIVDWSKTLPEWQSDAIRRILEKNCLSKEDEDELFRLFKIDNGLIPKDQNSIAAKPIFESKSTPTLSEKPPCKITLKKLYQIDNVNKLKAGEELDFEENGLTVIYGNNASGKSGYSRIFKAACKSRDVEPILPNVYEISNPAAKPKATFVISASGEEQPPIEWVDDGTSSSELKKISVFDSRCVRVYVESKDKEIEYQPYGADVFEKLVSLSRSFSDRLQEEKKEEKDLSAIFNAFPEMNRVRRLIAGLSAASTAEDIDKLAEMSPEEKKELIKIDRNIKERELKKLPTLISERKGKKQRISNLSEVIKRIDAKLCKTNYETLELIIDHLVAAKEAASLASSDRFMKEHLAGVGSDEWEKMFEAARTYSEKHAYPNQIFPYIGKDSHCVLCQQLLGDQAAKDRMKEFDLFVKDKANLTLKQNEEDFTAKIKELNDLDLDYLTDHTDLKDELFHSNPALLIDTEAYFAVSKKNRDNAILSMKNMKWQTETIIPLGSPNTVLQELIQTLDHEIADYQTLLNEDELKKEKTKYDDLKSRELLGQQKQAVLDHIAALIYNSKISEGIKKLNPRNITDKKRSLMQESAFKSLKEALEIELKSLGVRSFSIELAQRGSEGSVYFVIRLKGIKLPKAVDPLKVLSEGEQRALAIASFMAELRAGGNLSGIIFDDPVSSLDHAWREKIAERIVAEAKIRQVIVLTHNIAFLLELLELAKLNGVNAKNRSIVSWKGVAGIVGKEDETPWDALDVDKQIKVLLKEIQEVEKCLKANELSNEEYDSEIRKIYSKLRSSWERAVEQVLLGDTVMRYRKNIKTQKLQSVEITPEDCLRVEAAAGKCSKITDAHDKSPEAVVAVPDIEEVKADIVVLQRFISDIKSRRDSKRVV